jgi:hypothetical protein
MQHGKQFSISTNQKPGNGAYKEKITTKSSFYQQQPKKQHVLQNCTQSFWTSHLAGKIPEEDRGDPRSLGETHPAQGGSGRRHDKKGNYIFFIHGIFSFLFHQLY